VFLARAPPGKPPVTLASDILAHGAARAWSVTDYGAAFTFSAPAKVSACRKWLLDNHEWAFGSPPALSHLQAPRDSAALSILLISSVEGERAVVNPEFIEFLNL
jgi:hypothetical protein